MAGPNDSRADTARADTARADGARADTVRSDDIGGRYDLASELGLSRAEANRMMDTGFEPASTRLLAVNRDDASMPMVTSTGVGSAQVYTIEPDTNGSTAWAAGLGPGMARGGGR